MTTIGITGGNGFIGKWVERECHSLGYQTLIFDHHRHRFEHEPNEQFFGDIRDSIAVTEFAAHVDGIIHLAAVLGTQETITNPIPSAETNILGGINVFQAANQYGIPVTYAGVGNHWMREQGGGSYTITKTAVEDFAKMYNLYRGGKINVVRPVNAYGPGQSVAAPYGSSKVRKIMPSFICRALLNHNIEVYGDGTQVSDCVYVVDVARTFAYSMQHLLTSSAPLPRPTECGPVASITVQEIAQMIIDITESKSKIINLPMRPGEVPNAVVTADTSTLKDIDLDAEDFTPLDVGLLSTVNYFRNNWYERFVNERG